MSLDPKHQGYVNPRILYDSGAETDVTVTNLSVITIPIPAKKYASLEIVFNGTIVSVGSKETLSIYLNEDGDSHYVYTEHISGNGAHTTYESGSKTSAGIASTQNNVNCNVGGRAFIPLRLSPQNEIFYTSKFSLVAVGIGGYNIDSGGYYWGSANVTSVTLLSSRSFTGRLLVIGHEV